MIPEVFESIRQQIGTEFEWVVGDDGSEDGTRNILKDLVGRNEMRIKVISANKRIGKSRLDNLLLSAAEGEYILWLDSDNKLMPNSLKILEQSIRSIPVELESQYSGVAAYALDWDGRESRPQMDFMFSEPVSLMASELNIGDGMCAIKRSLFSNRKFPEVDLYINESVLLRKILKGKKCLLIPEYVAIFNRTTDNSISFGKKIRYSRGQSFAIARNDKAEGFLRQSMFQRIKKVSNYWRLSMHGDLKFAAAKRAWPITRFYNIWLAALPISIILVALDRVRGRVEKTHFLFNEGMNAEVIRMDSMKSMGT